MASKVTTLFEDSAKENALYPRTKVSAVSDNNGNGLEALLNAKQNQLVSGTNIKTINNESLVGSGNVEAGFKGIDGNNIIANGKSATFGSGTTYTATDDCWISMYFSSGIGGVKIDGGDSIFFSQSQSWGTFWFPLKKGQTVTIGSASQLGPNGTNDCVRVFGVVR